MELSAECQAEVDIMESAYGSDYRLCDISLNSDNCHENNKYGVSFTVTLSESFQQKGKKETASVTLKIFVPWNYPEEALKVVSLEGSLINAEMRNLKYKLSLLVEENPQCNSMEICQAALDYLHDYCNEIDNLEKIQHQMNYSMINIQQIKIVRCLIYYHHIRSEMKRAYIRECAHALQLSCICKIGYPGIVVIEGWEYHVLEFIRCVQRLRWKHMVVRGEESEVVHGYSQESPENLAFESTCASSTSHSSTTSDSGTSESGATSKEYVNILDDVVDVADVVEKKRKLRIRWVETDDMSVASDICKQYDLHSLFLTSMKIY